MKLKQMIISMLGGLVLLVGILLVMECVHGREHRIEARAPRVACELTADTVIELVHARRGLSCGSPDGKVLNDIYNARNHIAEIDMLMEVYTAAGCSFDLFYDKLIAHIESCTRCTEYVKCGT
jgi:hypothetical protein